MIISCHEIFLILLSFLFIKYVGNKNSLSIFDSEFLINSYVKHMDVQYIAIKCMAIQRTVIEADKHTP